MARSSCEPPRCAPSPPNDLPPAVHAPVWLTDGPLLRARALRLACPPDVALSDRTALWLLGLDVLGDRLDLTARLLEAGVELRRCTSADAYRRSSADLCADVLRAVRLAQSRPPSRLVRRPDTLRPPRWSPPPTRADRPAA